MQCDVFIYNMKNLWRYLLLLKISLFQAGNQKFKLVKKSHVPRALSRAKALLAKRSEKGYGNENAVDAVSVVPVFIKTKRLNTLPFDQLLLHYPELSISLTWFPMVKILKIT